MYIRWITHSLIQNYMHEIIKGLDVTIIVSTFRKSMVAHNDYQVYLTVKTNLFLATEAHNFNVSMLDIKTRPGPIQGTPQVFQ